MQDLWQYMGQSSRFERNEGKIAALLQESAHLDGNAEKNDAQLQLSIAVTLHNSMNTY